MVFDELEKSRSHILLQQMDLYFRKSAKGRDRAKLVIPEPLFVHSDLTTGIQIADIAAYLLSWAFRRRGLSKPIRPELRSFVDELAQLRNKAARDVAGLGPIAIWSIAVIDDLRAKERTDIGSPY